jgi:membrane protein DedA with SNARE-associated domain
VRATRLLHHYDVPLIIGIRFMYGLRIVGPMAIGMSGIRWLRFALLNFVEAVLWALVVVGIGYALGDTLTWLLDDLTRIERWAFAALLAVGIALAAVLLVRSRRKWRELH